MTPKQLQDKIRANERKAAVAHYLSTKGYLWYLRNWLVVSVIMLGLGWWFKPRVLELVTPVNEFLAFLSGWKVDQVATTIGGLFWVVFGIIQLAFLILSLVFGIAIGSDDGLVEYFEEAAEDYDKKTKELRDQLEKMSVGGPPPQT